MSEVEDRPEGFEDPGLKAAVCRVWGAERCPEALRRRVMGFSSASHASQLRALRIRPLWGLAAAALVLIGVGLIGWHWRGTSTSPSNSPLAVLPASLASDLVYRHDECSLSPEHRALGLSQDDPIELARQMRQKLNFPVLTARPGEGWHFRGAAFCPVGSQISGHLIYDRGGTPVATISVFSLPASTWPGDHSPDCAELAKGDHPIAGFATDKGVYCVVGSAKPAVTLPEVRRLLEHLRPELADDTDQPQAARTTVASNP